ncbi:MAG: GAF domain-containing protein [Nitrospirae bacterium]|nr:GAF domain-containing protein [Candidatus Manganitrophaceae bacterium]
MKKQKTAYSDINEVLSEITGDIVGQFDLPDLLNKVVGLAMRLLNAEVCSIFLDDKEKHSGRIRMMAGSGFAKRLVHKAEYKIGEGFTGFIFETGRKFNIKTKDELQNLLNKETGNTIWRGKHDGDQWQSGKNEFRNLIALPLIIKDQIFGVIKVENKDVSFGKHFSEEDERIFEIIANVVALAIENARLHNKIETQLKAISAKAAHRINNQTTNYDGIKLDLEEELDNQVCNKDNIKLIRNRLIETTSNLKKMIGEFKNYGKPIVLEKKYFSINKIIKDEVWYAKPADGIKIELNLDGKIPEILIDGRFTESVKELIINAMTAIENTSTSRGEIKISTMLQEKPKNKNVVIRIDDSGPGFPPNFPIFEPFNSTDPQSTGLGLATVKELVEKHGGEIEVISSQIGGASVEFTIPVLI